METDKSPEKIWRRQIMPTAMLPIIIFPYESLNYFLARSIFNRKMLQNFAPTIQTNRLKCQAEILKISV
ncbi:hypothetical protein C7N83_12660 [Neisseria iguanae]|uniref:Uncharacterized protein n=1 Tax=Neisseria iguanae TaxID=90242 RepID=A0A2P7TX95_9NEIS|nr:hypothetical protein C7N83_12660 [Neisseria iguanae]